MAKTRPWERDSLVCVFSCTKGVVAIATMWAVAQGLVDLDDGALVLAEFAMEGKGEIPGAVPAHAPGRTAGDRPSHAVRRLSDGTQ